VNHLQLRIFVAQLGTPPPPGGGQIDQSELFIIDNLFLLTWTSPRPQTRPQGAAKNEIYYHFDRFAKK
jgi:hypothetical protein